MGNRLSQSTTLAAVTTTRLSSYDLTSNRITGMTENSAALRNYTYDGGGNILTDTRPGEVFGFAYNARNRPASVTRNSVPYASYSYNAFEQLVARSTSAPGGPLGTVHYIHDLDGHIIAEADGSTGAITRDYIWMAANDNAPTDLPLAVAEGANLYMVHSDHLGRPARMTDTTKATVWQAAYNPHGEATSLSSTISNNLRFPGQVFQIETGLAYNWHRHYDPTTGRYTQPDPLGFVDGPSVYAYAGNSPFMVTDPTGLYCKNAGGKLACVHPDGPQFSIPAPKHYFPSFGPGGLEMFIMGHQYSVFVPLKCIAQGDALQGLINSPTPGNALPATIGGTQNNAEVFGVDNYVTSYLTNDLVTGQTLVVNLTGPGSLFGSGYVVRNVANGAVNTYGEGLNWLQSEFLFPVQNYFANDLLWGGQTEEFLSKISLQCDCN